DILRAGVERGFHQLVLTGAGREHELAAMPEQKCDRAVGAKIAAILGKCVTHIGYCSRLVVGHAIDYHRRAPDTVAFVAYFLVIYAFEIAGAALDRALDV